MRKLAIFLIFAAGMINPAGADIRKGMEAYNKDDYVTAYREFMESAKAGDPRAKLSVAMMHIRGQGVKIDLNVAIRWLREAAGQGDGDARMVLGDLYSHDVPSIKDYVKSYVWLTLALQKVRSTKRDDTVKMRITLSRRMTPEQIERAKNIAEQWNALDEEKYK
jgi:uncharacterized protein